MLTRKMTEEMQRIQKKLAHLQAEVVALRQQPGSAHSPSPAEAAAMLDESSLDRSRLSPGLIKKLRKRLRITQPELAALLNVSIAAVGFWESGTVKPRPEMRARIIKLRSLGRREARQLIEEAAKATPVPKRRGRPPKGQ